MVKNTSGNQPLARQIMFKVRKKSPKPRYLREFLQKYPCYQRINLTNIFVKTVKPRIKIDVVSDVVCPWCYIGKRRLEKATKQLSDTYDFEVNYLPFELMPEMPAEGRNTCQHLTQKFGSEAQYRQIVQHVTQIAAEEGLKFDLFNQEKSPNTRPLHRVIDLAKQQGKQLAVVEAFFKAYFEDATDLTDIQNVLQIAEDAGMARAEVAQLLENKMGENELEELLYRNKLMGVSGVPYYIINDKFAISGAQPAEVFVEALPNIAAQAPLAGEACDTETGAC